MTIMAVGSMLTAYALILNQEAERQRASWECMGLSNIKAIHLVLTYFSNNATPNTSQTVPLTGDLVVTIRSLWGSSHSNHHTSYRRQFGSQQTHRGLQTSLTPVHRI